MMLARSGFPEISDSSHLPDIKFTVDSVAHEVKMKGKKYINGLV
jgi:hypothetical protein